MAKMTSCISNGNKINIEEALNLRNQAESRGADKPEFLCIECNLPVRAHNAGGGAAAHFEHHERNSVCSLSHTI